MDQPATRDHPGSCAFCGGTWHVQLQQRFGVQVAVCEHCAEQWRDPADDPQRPVRILPDVAAEAVKQRRPAPAARPAVSWRPGGIRAGYVSAGITPPTPPTPSRPQRPSQREVGRDANRELAAWLREQGLPTSGPVWTAAKAGERDVERLTEVLRGRRES